MKKIFLIAKREFYIRFRNKKFWMVTLLGPILLAVFIVVAGFIMSYSGDKETNIVILDEANLFDGSLKDQYNFYFSFTDTPLDELRATEEPDFNGILYLPESLNLNQSEVSLNFYTTKNLNLESLNNLKSIIQSEIRDYKLKQLNITQSQLARLDTRVAIQSEDIDPEVAASESSTVKSSEFSSYLGAGIGMLMGLIMYMLVFMNGSMVMQSVMEEKTNRIVEVIISSVKPFELMMGKIIGVGIIGIVQFLSWAILLPVIVMLGSLVFGFQTDMDTLESMNAAGTMSEDDMEYMVYQFMKEVDKVPWFKIVSLFILFFIGGYLIYSSLFAAVGSAVGDDMQDSQSLVIPISIPVVMAFYIMITTLRVPDSTLSVWSSIFPLFSPIVMPARLAFDPPWWQIILSLVLLGLTVVGLIWVSGRIYRVGILMYGKKASMKELWKWIFYKE